VASLVLSLTWIAVQIAGVGLPLPAVHRITGVPRVERTVDWCGPAALAAVVTYHGEQTSAKEIAQEIYLSGFRGSLNLDLLVFARRHGYLVWAEEGTPERVQEAIARDRPVICMVRRKDLLASRNHMVVVTGFDRKRGVWFIDAGGGREEVANVAEFNAEWAGCARWMLVVEGKSGGRPARGPGAAAGSRRG